MEIYFPNGSFEVFFVESYSTIEELKLEILSKYDFDTSKQAYYGLYEYT